jgi:hypothetical protein
MTSASADWPEGVTLRPWRTVFWLLILLGGFGLMFFSYWCHQRVEYRTPWADAVMCVAEDGAPQEAARLGSRLGVARFLPLPPEAETFTQALLAADSASRRSFIRNRQEKTILLPDFYGVFTQEMLASGRLPSPRSREAVAGHDASQKGEIRVAGEAFQVVGVLRPQQWPFSNAYIVPDDPARRSLFDLRDESVKQVFLFTQAGWKESSSQGADLLPKARFTRVVGAVRAARAAYYAYLLGMALLFCGGSALLTAAFVCWSEKTQGRWIGPALAEIRRRRRLFHSLHLVYFGLCLGCMLVIYEVPDVQGALLVAVGAQVEDGSGPLGVAGRAYRSQNIARAAVVTLGVNFVVGSFAVITLPSLVLPGIGVLMAAWRAMLWGLLLAPTHLGLSRVMLAHSATLLLEGEAYILAAFFALLIPLCLFDRKAGTTVGSRYGRAILMNLRGNLLVLLVLALAAIYEAVEVILQMKG